jgi:autotransporter-associated beta strand protein
MTLRLFGGVVLAVAAVVGLPGKAPGQSNFTAGNLVIYQVGNGTETSLINTGNSVLLQEFTQAGGTGTTVALPNGTTVSGPPFLIASGTASSEGMLTLGNGGRTLALTGYNAAVGGSTPLPGSASATINRTVALVNGQGTATLTTLNDFSTASNPRGAYTTDGTSIYATGGAGGVRYTTAGSSTSTQLSTTVTNLRGVAVYAGQLYVSDSSGTAVRLGAVGTGTPTTSGQTITNLPGFPASTGSPYQFVFFRIDNPTTPLTFAGPNVLYVADDGANQIQKYTFDGSTWTAQGAVTATAVRGLTGLVTADNQITLFGTTGGFAAAGGGTLYTFTDGAPATAPVSGTASSLATAAANTAFRGVAFAPARLVWAGGTGTWDLLGTNWTNTAVTGTPASKFVNAYAANFGDTATDAAVTVGQGVYPLAVNVTNAANTYTFTTGAGSNGIQGLAALTKVGAGTLVLAGPNTYSGGTFIAGGTVVAGNGTTGSATGVGSVTVASGGTLAGTGRIAPLSGSGVVVQPGGTLAPGPVTSGAGTLTIAGGDTVLGTGSNFRVRVTGGSPGSGGSSTSPAFPAQTTNTGLDVTVGTLTISDGTNIVIDGTGVSFTLNQPYSYVVARAPSPGSLTVGSATPSFNFSTIGFSATSLSLTASGNLVILNFTPVTPVPEPATVLGVAAAGLGLAGLARRRSTKTSKTRNHEIHETHERETEINPDPSPARF